LCGIVKAAEREYGGMGIITFRIFTKQADNRFFASPVHDALPRQYEHDHQCKCGRKHAAQTIFTLWHRRTYRRFRYLLHMCVHRLPDPRFRPDPGKRIPIRKSHITHERIARGPLRIVPRIRFYLPKNPFQGIRTDLYMRLFIKDITKPDEIAIRPFGAVGFAVNVRNQLATAIEEV
jgi:hypothetical protein